MLGICIPRARAWTFWTSSICGKCHSDMAGAFCPKCQPELYKASITLPIRGVIRR